MRFWPAPLGVQYSAEWHTWLIMLNYLSFKFRNPLKERVALAASPCLPTHRGDRGLSCLNYVTLLWAEDAGNVEGLVLGPPPKSQSPHSTRWPVIGGPWNLRPGAL